MIKKLSIPLDALFPQISRLESEAPGYGGTREQKRRHLTIEVIRPYAQLVVGGVSLSPELQKAQDGARFLKERCNESRQRSRPTGMPRLSTGLRHTGPR
jgi:hypothetical protein